jgi:5-methylcytosine-specific restriction endonuclease McrA
MTPFHKSTIPYGFCQCGCGNLAPIADENDNRKGWIKGEPKKFLPHHHQSLSPSIQNKLKQGWKEGSTSLELEIKYGVPREVIYSLNKRIWRIPHKKLFRLCPRCKMKRVPYGKRYCSSECKGPKVMPRGENNPNWRGGKSLGTVRLTPEYKKWRTDVFVRDNFTCVQCGQRGGRLNADHILPQSIFKEKIFDVSNGRTLCLYCHRKTPTFGRKLKDWKKMNKALVADWQQGGHSEDME